MILLQGRVHCYEGYSMQDVTFPVRVLGMMGVEDAGIMEGTSKPDYAMCVDISRGFSRCS